MFISKSFQMHEKVNNSSASYYRKKTKKDYKRGLRKVKNLSEHEKQRLV